MGYYLQYCFIRILRSVASLLPWAWIAALTRAVTGVVYRLYGSRRRIALRNLDRAYGKFLKRREKEAIARRSFQHIGLSLVEFFLMKKSMKTARADFKFSGLEHLKTAFARGKGVVLVISHLGSWENLSMLPYLTAHRWSVVVKRIKNPHVDRDFNRLRRAAKLTPIYKKGSVRPVLKQLRANHGVAILIDQWAGPEGLWQDFFGHATSTTDIPARLAKKMGSALIPAYCIRRGDHAFEIQIHPELPKDKQANLSVPAITKKLNEGLEAQIRKYPDQWFWGHKRWKPRPKRSAALEAVA